MLFTNPEDLFALSHPHRSDSGSVCFLLVVGHPSSEMFSFIYKESEVQVHNLVVILDAWSFLDVQVRMLKKKKKRLIFQLSFLDAWIDSP